MLLISGGGKSFPLRFSSDFKYALFFLYRKRQPYHRCSCSTLTGLR